MFSCKKASRLISDSLDRELTPKERTALRFHLMICRICRRFRRNMIEMNSVKEVGGTHLEDLLPEESLPQEKKDRLRKLLDEEIKRMD